MQLLLEDESSATTGGGDWWVIEFLTSGHIGGDHVVYHLNFIDFFPTILVYNLLLSPGMYLYIFLPILILHF